MLYLSNKFLVCIILCNKSNNKLIASDEEKKEGKDNSMILRVPLFIIIY